MGILSKAWKGVKGAIKKVAKGVKKVAKAAAYATPLGKKAWDLSTKVGEGAMKVVGKVVSAIGPVGMMALSAVLAVTGVGAPIAAMLQGMWAGFGAGAAAMAASANVLVSAVGTVGSSIFAAGNFIAGTVGALGNAFTQGASEVMAGNFSAGMNTFATNISSALSGEAGMAAVNAASAIASNTAGTLASDAASQLTTETATQLASDGVIMQSPVGAETAAGLTEAQLAAQDTLLGTSEAAFAANNSSAVADIGSQALSEAAGESVVTQATLDAQVANYGMTVEQLNAIPNAGNAFVTNGASGARGIAAAQIGEEATVTEAAKKVKKAYDKGKDLLGTPQSNVGYQTPASQPLAQLQPIQSQVANSTGNRQGQGTSGFSLLSGVRGLEQTLRNSQRQMNLA